MRNRIIFRAVTFATMICLLATAPLFAGDPSRIGTAAGEQLLVPVGARDLALGGANVAFSSGLDAMYWNPAGFSSMKNTAAGMFSTMTIFNSVDVNYMGLGLNVGRIGTIGFSLKVFDFGDIPITTNQDIDGESGATYSPSYMTAALTYSRRLSDAVQVGMNAKFITERIPRASANAMAFDAGIQYHNLGGINGMSMGLVVKNIGTNMQYTGSAFLAQAVDVGSNNQEYREKPTSRHQLPATVELGVGYRRNINENNNIVFMGNFENFNFGNDNFKMGAEYAYNDLIFLRGGYLITQKTDAADQLYRFTLGVGLHYKYGNTDIQLDYAFRDSQYFDGNNLFSLSLGF